MVVNRSLDRRRHLENVCRAGDGLCDVFVYGNRAREHILLRVEKGTQMLFAAPTLEVRKDEGSPREPPSLYAPPCMDVRKRSRLHRPLVIATYTILLSCVHACFFALRCPPLVKTALNLRLRLS